MPSPLPKDIKFKGHSDVVIQDIKIVTDNVKYRREIYYSPSEKKTYLDLPSDIAGKGEYGVGIRSLIPLLKSECNLSESCILDFFQNVGIVLSSAYISNQWTKGYDLYILDEFLSRYWFFYHKLIAYQKEPDPTKISLLTQEFDALFSTQTEYEQLNDRIAKTLAKQQELLLVLKYPDVPLHNPK